VVVVVHKVSRATAEHYVWGGRCDGWHFAKTDGLSVIVERMPPGTSEQRHLHERARQVFLVLAGTASFEVDGVVETLLPGEAVDVPPGVPHMMMNRSGSDLEFVVVSAPKSHGDRLPA
jgi:mannose-6-phosphate isomerase-like protein (cupin superfamily)